MNTSTVIVLVEPFWIGHPETQLKFFIESLLREKQNRILVLCQHPEVIQTWIETVHPVDALRCFTAHFAFCDNRGDYPNTRLASWARAHQVMLESELRFGFTVSKVFITWLDQFICNAPDQVASLMPRPWVGLYLFPAYLRKHPYLFRWFKDEHMIRDRSFFRTPFCRGVALLDEGIQKSLAWHIAPHKVHVLPDVANIDVTPDAPPLTQALLQQAAGRPIIGLLGVLGRRKGTLPYLRAMHQIKDNRCFFLLAGQLGSAERKTYGQDEPELDQLLSTATQQKNTFIHLGHIENEETINSLVSACTILYLAYDGHQHSSGILGKAAHFKKLVIGPATGCVADRIRKFKIGLTIKAGSDTETIKAVKTLSHAPSYAKLWNQARFTAYQAQHNCESLDRSLTALLKDIP